MLCFCYTTKKRDVRDLWKSSDFRILIILTRAITLPFFELICSAKYYYILNLYIFIYICILPNSRKLYDRAVEIETNINFKNVCKSSSEIRKIWKMMIWKGTIKNFLSIFLFLIHSCVFLRQAFFNMIKPSVLVSNLT